MESNRTKTRRAEVCQRGARERDGSAMSDALNLDDAAKQAIDLLKSNPELYRTHFDSVYGKGMAGVVLEQPDIKGVSIGAIL